ncbi:MAG TPA: rhodanese-like domain-containing protein [Candidatus Sericytochromatia bacterium]|jgi:rhodanese-related sulfurtransferase
MSEVEDAILKAKDKLPNVTPTPPSQQTPQSSAQALKQRLEWGEPAFTVLDVRERTAFNQSRILGAMTMSMEELVDRAKSSLEPIREIYIYGETDEQSAEAANKLREAGFNSVSELRGGLAGWKAIGGPTEGTAEVGYDASAAEYNVKARLDKHAEVTSKNP